MENSLIKLINGYIYTVDSNGWENNPQETMIYESTGNIVYVGSEKGSQKYEEEFSRSLAIIDLGGKTVFPGFIDTHVHPPGNEATKLYEIDLHDCHTFDNTIEKIREYIKDNPKIDTYIGTGLDVSIRDKAGEGPQAKWIDSVCSDKPVVIQSYDMHSMLYNTKAMKMTGRNKESQTRGSGRIFRYKNGELTGLFTDVMDLPSIKPQYSAEQQVTALKNFMKTMNEWGYTSFMSIAPSLVFDMDRYKDISDSELTLRVNVSQFIKPSDYENGINKLIETKKIFREREKNGFIKVTTGKIPIDGVIEGCTALLNEPYCDAAGMGKNYYGSTAWDRQTLLDTVYRVNKAGFQVHFHSIGDGATELVMDAIEYSQGKLQCKNYRNVITHLQLVSEHDKDRMAKENVIGAIQPFWHFKEPGWYENIDAKVLGHERAESEYPAKSLYDKGIVLTASGDYPVSPLNNPFLAIQAGTTRNTYCEALYGVKILDPNDSRYLLNKAERLTVPQLIEAYTINGAYQLFREDEIGSLKAGKKADYIVVDRDIIKGNILDIENSKILQTVVDGRTVYKNIGVK